MNQLAKEASSYLHSASQQPVDWFPWSAEAFEHARKQDKPILLDIGAVWCHWCHVMDHESYEDPELAKLLNEHFVPVKVDRDERPDVDARYQKAIQAMTGQGGWPLTAFLMPDGRPFYGGTYFPPRDAQGRPSFRRVLEAVADSYRNRRSELEESAQRLTEHLAPRESAPGVSVDVDEDTLEQVVGRIQQAFDPEWGGFGRAPKFPHASGYDFLLGRATRGDAAARDMLVSTLERMRAGGVYDQLAGGFHRYSVDRQWLVPHFEKMLYDNAGLLRNYSRAGHAFGRPDLVQVADDIAAWMRDVLANDGRLGFGGSQDADVGMEDDGDHFTWTLAELREAVADEGLARLASLHFGVGEQGHMHHDPSRNVLHVEADAEALAAATGADVAQVRKRLDEAMARMREARAKRPVPFIDPIRYTSWNGMAIQALLEHAGRTGNREWDTLALRALDAFLDEAWEPRRGFARRLGSDTYGLLDDNAQMLDALLEAHLATGQDRYLEAARATADLLVTHFAHPGGGFADRSPTLAPDAEGAPLAQPERPVQDAPTASPNGVALRAMLRLADATGESRYRSTAQDALRALAPEALHLGLFGGALLLATEDMLRPPVRVEADSAAHDVRALVRRHARPGAVIVVPSAALPSGAVLVCLGDRCLAPARGEAELKERLAEASRG